MYKVMTIVGTRPEIIKLACVMSELDKHTKHILVHTGQNYDYELNQIFFDDLGVKKPDYFLEAVGTTVAETIGNIIAKSDNVMAVENPDAVLLYGDTNSCLAVIAAKRRKIPIFHMEAGNRALICESRRKLIVRLWTILQISIWFSPSMPAVIFSPRESDQRQSLKPVLQ